MVKGRIKIDEAICKGCGLSVVFCPKNLLVLDTERVNERGYNPSTIKNMKECVGCASCGKMCPEAAITVMRMDQ